MNNCPRGGGLAMRTIKRVWVRIRNWFVELEDEEGKESHDLDRRDA